MPFAVILGEDEQAQGKVKIKEMGATGSEKEGVLVDLKELVAEVKMRLRRATDSDDVGDVTAATNGLDLAAKTESSMDQTGDNGV